MTEPGRVVILNGASSSGKTTLATAFRARRAEAGELWLMTGIDDYLAKLPREWVRAGAVGGRFAADGLTFERTSLGVEVRVGSVCRQLFRAYQAGVGAAARAGVDVIVDDVAVDRTHWREWAGALAGIDVTWVGVRCSLEVAEERERARGDARFLGLTRAQSAVVHRDVRYRFEIDTTSQTPDEATSELLRNLGY